MKYKIIFNQAPLYIEVEAANEAERKEAIKGIIYAMKDLTENNLLGYPQTFESAPVFDNSEATTQEVQPEKLATKKQKDFMDKLGIQYNDQTTMVWAADAIKQWKIAHGYNV